MEKIKIASVKFNEGDKQTYYYECPLNDVSVGDFVLVDANGQTKVVQVVNLEQFDPCDAPYPLDKLKKILSKCDETTIAKKKDPIKAATAALHEKQEAIRKLLQTQKLLYPFDVKIDAKDEKTFSDLLNGNGDNIRNLLGQTPNDVMCFMPQIFTDPHDQNAALLAFSSKNEIGKLEDTALFLPASLDSIIAFVCDRLPYVTKIIVNPWSDGWVIPIITKIMLTVTVKERWDKVKVVQSISIQRDGIDSCTTVLDTDERDQNWQLGVNTEADYLAWFHAMVTLACSARKEKQPLNSDKSEIGIYYFYGNDNFEYVPFAAESLPDSVKGICKRITAAVPDDLYLAFTKYKMI